MTLLKVTHEDFNLFKPLYINNDIQWLYKRSEDTPIDESFDPFFELGEESIKALLDSYINYSPSEFYEEIATNDVYFICENNVINGFISIRRNKRIYDWAMKDPTLEKAKSVITQLVKLRPRFKKGLNVACCPSQYRYIIEGLDNVSIL